jgi:hypothetical protein
MNTMDKMMGQKVLERALKVYQRELQLPFALRFIYFLIFLILKI